MALNTSTDIRNVWQRHEIHQAFLYTQCSVERNFIDPK